MSYQKPTSVQVSRDPFYGHLRLGPVPLPSPEKVKQFSEAVSWRIDTPQDVSDTISTLAGVLPSFQLLWENLKSEPPLPFLHSRGGFYWSNTDLFFPQGPPLISYFKPFVEKVAASSIYCGTLIPPTISRGPYEKVVKDSWERYGWYRAVQTSFLFQISHEMEKIGHPFQLLDEGDLFALTLLRDGGLMGVAQVYPSLMCMKEKQKVARQIKWRATKYPTNLALVNDPETREKSSSSEPALLQAILDDKISEISRFHKGLYHPEVTLTPLSENEKMDGYQLLNRRLGNENDIEELLRLIDIRAPHLSRTILKPVVENRVSLRLSYGTEDPVVRYEPTNYQSILVNGEDYPSLHLKRGAKISEIFDTIVPLLIAYTTPPDFLRETTLQVDPLKPIPLNPRFFLWTISGMCQFFHESAVRGMPIKFSEKERELKKLLKEYGIYALWRRTEEIAELYPLHRFIQNEPDDF